MSHIHSISGQAEAAAQYQAYLERTRFARNAEAKEKAQRKSAARSFESYIDPDQNSDQNSGQDPSQDQEDESKNKGFSAKA
jgi:hypothetical protein